MISKDNTQEFNQMFLSLKQILQQITKFAKNNENALSSTSKTALSSIVGTLLVVTFFAETVFDPKFKEQDD